MKENYIYKIWKKYKNLVFICLDSDMYVGIDKGILIPQVLEMNICLVIYSSFHILFLEDFLGPSLYTDVHLHSHVMGSKKMKLTCQWFHTAKNLEQVVTQKIWIQSGFSLSIMILDLHLIRQFRASLWWKQIPEYMFTCTILSPLSASSDFILSTPWGGFWLLACFIVGRMETWKVPRSIFP